MKDSSRRHAQGERTKGASRGANREAQEKGHETSIPQGNWLCAISVILLRISCLPLGDKDNKFVICNMPA